MPRSFVGLLTEDRDFAGVARAGAGVTRLTIQVDAPTSLSDQRVLAAARSGLHVIPMLVTAGGYVPGNAADHGFRPPDPDRFAAQAAVVARRYGPGGSLWAGANAGLAPYAITQWQVWNEPNLAVWWWPGPNPEAYARLVRASANAIHGVDGRAQIVTAGIPDSTLDGTMPYDRFLARFLDAGGARDADVIGLNAYARDVDAFKEMLTTARRVADAHGAAHAKLWVGEFGWASTGPASRFTVGRDQQASLISDALMAGARLRRSLHLTGMEYYTWRDPSVPADTRDTWGLHTGLLDTGWHPKQAYRAFSRTVRQIVGD